MAARKNATPAPTSTHAGILQPEELARHCSLVRTACDEALQPWVENHWTLSWDLPAGYTILSQTLPHPACTLSIELGHPRVGLGQDRVVPTGVETHRFDVELRGSGWVHATKFRPGGLAALTGLDASVLTNKTRPAIEFIPKAVVEALRALHAGTPALAAGARSDAALTLLAERKASANGADYATVLGLVHDMLDDRTVLRVAQLEERHGLSSRQIQRLFARYVGASPKWVLARYRIHDIVTALDHDYAGTMADLAAQFGFYDQGHFAQQFNALVGVPPSVYRNRLRSAPGPRQIG